MGQLEGKVALVTGGGTGIGRATALRFAEEGADLAINYSRSKDDADRTVSDIEALGRKAVAIQADVSDSASAIKMVDRTVDHLGRLDILVNNAGVTRKVDLDDLDGLTDEDWDHVMSVNVKGAFYACRAAIPRMKETGGGRIINVASIAGSTGQGSSIAYAASKAACISLVKSLAVSQAPEIQVNAVSPGLVETRWVEGWEESNKVQARSTPMRRNAVARDVAEAIFGLATSGFVTGQNLIVDGGRTLWLSAAR